jgi:hypothetical protein
MGFNFDPEKTVQSQARPGVSFRVRVLSKIQRARLDAELLQPRSESIVMLSKIRAWSDESGVPRDEFAVELFEADAKMRAVLDERVKPAVMRHGLISVEGFTVSGREVIRAEEFIELAPEDLFEEAYEACSSASGLSAEAQKNSQSPSTSDEAEPAEASNMTASGVSAPAGS